MSTKATSVEVAAQMDEFQPKEKRRWMLAQLFLFFGGLCRGCWRVGGHQTGPAGLREFPRIGANDPTGLGRWPDPVQNHTTIKAHGPEFALAQSFSHQHQVIVAKADYSTSCVSM